jgi:SNF2 family DNA or RNA helicase
MLVLQRMLQFFISRGQKVLVFSYSTRVMDLIQLFIKGQGWQFRRLDGG